MSKMRKYVNPVLLDLKRGNIRALESLYMVARNHLIKLANSYLDNKDFGEDIVMEVFKKLPKIIYRFDEKQDGYNWLCKIVQNAALDCNKKNRREIPSTYLEKGTYDNVDESMLRQEERDEVEKLVQALPEPNRTVIIQRFWENKTLVEVGEMIGMKKSNVHKIEIKTEKYLLKLLENGGKSKD